MPANHASHMAQSTLQRRVNITKATTSSPRDLIHHHPMPPQPTPKRRRLSDDVLSSPGKPRPPSHGLLPSFMTPTKASLAKTFPHLLPPTKTPTTTRAKKRVTRSSIPPEGLTEVVETIGESEVDVSFSGEKVSEVEAVTPSTRRPPEGKGQHVERYKASLLFRVRKLRAECGVLEQQVDNARQVHDTRATSIDTAMCVALQKPVD
jgi:hypothetical protein